MNEMCIWLIIHIGFPNDYPHLMMMMIISITIIIIIVFISLSLSLFVCFKSFFFKNFLQNSLNSLFQEYLELGRKWWWWWSSFILLEILKWIFFFLILWDKNIKTWNLINLINLILNFFSLFSFFSSKGSRWICSRYVRVSGCGCFCWTGNFFFHLNFTVSLIVDNILSFF